MAIDGSYHRFLSSWQAKLREHGFPYLLILKAFIEGGYSSIDRVEDTRQDMLEHDRGFFKETVNLLNIALQNFTAQGSKIFDIDSIVVYDEPVVAHVAQVITREQRFQSIWV